MTLAARKKTAQHSPEALEKRVSALTDRVSARAEKEAETELESLRRVESKSWIAEDLSRVEAEIRELSHHKEELTTYGVQRLGEARAYRAELREKLARQQEGFNRRAQEILGHLERSRRAVRKARRQAAPRDRLLGILEGLEPLAEFLTAHERATLDGLRASAEAIEEASAEAEEAALEPEAPPVEAPPPAPWEFEAPGPEFFAPRSPQGERDLREYRVDRWAQELSLVRGFDVLLTPQLAHGLVQYPHQIETARTVLRRMRGRALLCDEVGLGKTVEAGIIARELVSRALARRILILVPPALVSQWSQEMKEKFDLLFVTHDDPEFRQLGPEAWGRFDRILASLHTARLPAHRERLAKEEFDLIIVDEAHHLRSRTSQSWKFVNELKKRYILLLTATPVQNNLDELFNLITLLSPGQLKTSAAFRREFVTRGDPRSPRNRERLRQLLAEVMVRNTRSQVHVALPPRMATTHRLAPTPEEASVYTALTEYARERYAAGSLDRLAAGTLFRQAGSSAPALVRGLEGMAERRPADRKRLLELAEAARGISHHAKAEALGALLTRRPEKTIVFTFFRETLHMLEGALRQAGVSFATLSGEQTAAEKDRAVAEFQADRRVLLSTEVGSEGRNLQFCHALANFDLPWNPMRIEQRVGRVHRIGQKEEVLIDNFCARHTVEDYILRVLDAKLNMFELVIGEIGSILGNLEAEQEFDDLALDIWAAARDETEAAKGFDELADRLQEARERYQEAQELDEALFGGELATPAEAP